MAIQMVGADTRTAASLTFRPNAEQESKRTMGEAGSGFNSMVTAGDERQDARHDHYVRTSEGNIENRQHGGSLANWLGATLNPNRADDSFIPDVGAEAATAPPAADPTGQPPNSALVPGSVDTTS